MQQDLFLPTICNPCLLDPQTVKAEPLSVCLGCKLILYCSSAHQKLDWPIHKPFCQAARAIMSSYHVDHLMDINGVIKTQDDLYITILKVKYMLKGLLERKLEHHEEELTSFPLMCAVCFSTKRSKLYQCKGCNSVSYCCENHEQQHHQMHRFECLQLKIYYCKFKTSGESLFKISLLQKCNLLESNLAIAMKTMFGIELSEDPCVSEEEYQLFSFVSSFSCVATIAYVMAHLAMSNFNGDQFTVYIAGATNDYVWFTTTHLQFLCACYPEIKRWNLFFVGPELVYRKPRTITLSLDGGRKVYQALYRNTLEDYFMGTPGHLKPNMIVCYNSGFSECRDKDPEEDPWTKGISYLMDLPEVPIVFTSYTNMEANFDYGALMSVADERKETDNMRLENIISKHDNPYRDMRPVRNWQFNDQSSIFYRNGIIQAVRVKFNKF